MCLALLQGWQLGCQRPTMTLKLPYFCVHVDWLRADPTSMSMDIIWDHVVRSICAGTHVVGSIWGGIHMHPI